MCPVKIAPCIWLPRASVCAQFSPLSALWRTLSPTFIGFLSVSYTLFLPVWLSQGVGLGCQLREGLRDTRALWFRGRFFKSVCKVLQGGKTSWNLASTEHRAEPRVIWQVVQFSRLWFFQTLDKMSGISLCGFTFCSPAVKVLLFTHPLTELGNRAPLFMHIVYWSHFLCDSVVIILYCTVNVSSIMRSPWTCLSLLFVTIKTN